MAINSFGFERGTPNPSGSCTRCERLDAVPGRERCRDCIDYLSSLTA